MSFQKPLHHAGGMMILILVLSIFIGCSVGPSPVAGKVLVPVFPKEERGLELVFTAEKRGFVQALMQKKGKDLATLAITDLLTDESARAKFRHASDRISGYPAVSRDQGTAILVNERFQISVRTLDAVVGTAERKEILSKFFFDLLP